MKFILIIIHIHTSMTLRPFWLGRGLILPGLLFGIEGDSSFGEILELIVVINAVTECRAFLFF